MTEPTPIPEVPILEDLDETQLAQLRATGEMPLPPSVLQIETTSICNFRCPSCPLSMADYDRPEKHMSPAEFTRVLEGFPSVRKIELQGIGEVFLNDQVFELVRLARERGVEVQTFSNASKIDRPIARAIVESGLSLINLSMDGADEPTFRKLRKGGTLTRFRRSVKNLVAARRAAASATPTINVMVVVQQENLAQVPQLIALAEELGVDGVILTKINTDARPEIRDQALSAEDRDALHALGPHRGSVEVHWALEPWTREQRMSCYWPRSAAYVTVEGHVTACCNHYDERELPLGNVFEETGEEIWNGEAYRAFRRRVWNGDLPPRCKNC